MRADTDSATIHTGLDSTALGGNLARRRYQKGSLRKRVGKTKTVWVAQWREDVIESGQVRRVFRKESWDLSAFPTKKLAERELERRLSHVNSLAYRPTYQQTFGEFATEWGTGVLTMHKPSSQNSEKVHISKYIVPFFGKRQLTEITPGMVQQWVASLRVAPKTARNIYATFRSMWKCAKRWERCQHNACEGIMMPRLRPVERPCFTIEDMTRIIQEADEPFKTFFWLAAETGMRAGELCGLRWQDISSSTVQVRQSVWNGQTQTPKTVAAVRQCDISEGLAQHLRDQARSVGDRMSFVFATRTGQPWDARFIVRDKLQPILVRLGITRAGLHAFRHGHATYRLQQGEDVKSLATRLGHSDPTVTLKVYAHATQNTAMSDKMGKILMPTDAKRVSIVPQVASDQQVTATA